MRKGLCFGLAVAAAVLGAAVTSDAFTATSKFRLIENERVPPGSKVTIHQDELNAYVRAQVREVAPDGVRDPRVELGQSRATGFAWVDFEKLRRAQGQPMGWLMARLIGGEKPVRVDAQIRSGGGKAVVDVQRVEVSGVAISGPALDFLIRNFLWSYYPEAKVGRPFELAHRIERLDVQPERVNVVIGK
ncbi:MAG TPA: hypothetical protein VHA11_12155 [Bryobacteraceae bacterium]|nr:hypothetical protein [Bryobacteraceae bacterium]